MTPGEGQLREAVAEDDGNALAAGDLVIGHVDPVDLDIGDGGHLAGECGHSKLPGRFPYLGQTRRGYGKGGTRGIGMAVEAGSGRAPRSTWGLVVLLGALTAFAPMGIDMYLPSLPAIGADLGVSGARTQVTVSAFLAGMAIGQFFYGPASDRLGRKGPILAGVALFVLASCACALAPSADFLIAARFVQALGALLKDKRLVGYALAGGLNGATLFTWISASPGLLIGVWGIPASIFGWVFGLNAAGVIGAGQINRQLLLRYTPEQVLKAASLAGVAASILLLLAAFTGWGGMWSVLPLIFLVLSSYGFMAGNTMAGALNVDPRRAGSISALMGSASFAAGALASALTGALGDGSARPVAVTMFLAMSGSALALRTLALKGTARV